VAALTEADARARAALIEVVSYGFSADLNPAGAGPVRSRAEIRFTCAEPGAATFADLAATATRVVLNGREVPGQPDSGRLALRGLAAENTLVVDAEVADEDLFSRFTEPGSDDGYLMFCGLLAGIPRLFCCFDQAELTATMTLSLLLPGGWDCLANGPVTGRPPAGEAGRWQFGPVTGSPAELMFAAGPYQPAWSGEGGADSDEGGADSSVRNNTARMSIWCRRSLAGTLRGLERFAGLARQALAYYEWLLGVPCPYPKYDIGFVPRLSVLAVSTPGLMLVSESVLTRMDDPADDFVAVLCAHEVAHLWFGCHVAAGWWDDLWQNEAIATYVGYGAVEEAGLPEPWTAFCYREKERAYAADGLPSRQPVSSPVATAAEAYDRPTELLYFKGAAVIRQLAALIGDDALRAGLADYMDRFGGGTAGLDDLIACWSAAAGRDLRGWAREWLRTEGASTLRVTMTLLPSVTGGPDGTLGSLVVEQDQPRTHRLGIGLYERSPAGILRRRRLISAEVSGARCEVAVPPGEPVPDAVIPNDGDLTYAEVALDEATLAALAGAAMSTGDPVTEAVAWNAVWRMVTAGSLSGADFAGLVTRRVGASPAVDPVSGLEILLGRAVRAADVYTPATERGGVRVALASACLAGAGAGAGLAAGAGLGGAGAAAAGSQAQRVLAAGFAASAHSGDQLAQARSWLDGGPRPDGLDLDGVLRGRLLRTLAARGLATDEDLDGLAAADPVAGAQNRAACLAARPDAAAKTAAWELAIDRRQDRRMAEAAAGGFWVPGQLAVLAPFNARYFSEALPALENRDTFTMRRLAGMLYPVTLAGTATLAATAAALAGGGLSPRLRLVLLDQQAIMRSVIAARSAPRRGW
jgi:aminopeptidase N